MYCVQKIVSKNFKKILHSLLIVVDSKMFFCRSKTSFFLQFFLRFQIKHLIKRSFFTVSKGTSNFKYCDFNCNAAYLLVVMSIRKSKFYDIDSSDRRYRTLLCCTLLNFFLDKLV